MGINVIDVGTSQRNLDFALAARQGWAACYVKLGGDNVGRYVAPNYVSQTDRARAAGMRIGHYWVPSNRQDPAGAADYFVNNLRGWTSSDFAVLDNESLDGAVRYSDAQAAVWIERVKARLGISGEQVFTYSGLADARTTAWPAVLGTGSNFILAAYSYPAGQHPVPGTIPAARVKGHQYGGGAIANGVVTDTNLFTDDAFSYSGSSTAGGGNTPIDNRKKDQNMSVNLFFQRFSDGNMAHVVERDWGFQIVDEAWMAALRKGYDLEEIEVNESDWFAISQTKSYDIAAYKGIDPSAQIDTVAIVRTLTDAVVAAVKEMNPNVEFDYAELAAKVNGPVLTAINGIPDAVADEAADRLQG